VIALRKITLIPPSFYAHTYNTMIISRRSIRSVEEFVDACGGASVVEQRRVKYDSFKTRLSLPIGACNEPQGNLVF
jgi:hypothetical protein